MKCIRVIVDGDGWLKGATGSGRQPWLGMAVSAQRTDPPTVHRVTIKFFKKNTETGADIFGFC